MAVTEVPPTPETAVTAAPVVLEEPTESEVTEVTAVPRPKDPVETAVPETPEVSEETAVPEVMDLRIMWENLVTLVPEAEAATEVAPQKILRSQSPLEIWTSR